jgi:metal-dependent amidase/aminoacylase/carboxypeptidase family protein
MEHIPSSLFIFLGGYDEASGSIYPVHNEKFRINEQILHVGAAEYAQFAADYLESRGEE